MVGDVADGAVVAAGAVAFILVEDPLRSVIAPVVEESIVELSFVAGASPLGRETVVEFVVELTVSVS
jgi:hypothetical protein